MSLKIAPRELITREIALKFNATIWDILNNRRADYFAKKAVDLIRKTPKKDIEVKHQQIASWQLFLAKVSAFVADSQTEPVNLPEGEVPNQQPQQEEIPSSAFGKILPHNVHGALPISVFQDLLPRWEWQPNLIDYSWFPSFEIKSKTNVHAKISAHDWDIASSFFKGLQWKCGEAFQISFLELAAQANFLKLTFDAGTAPAEIATVLKKFLSVVVKEGHASQTFPGVIVKKCKSNGKTFPSGLIQGGYAAVHPEALKCLAIPFLRGRDHRLSQWKVPFDFF